ncbi:MAG: hypothetical protein SW127_01685 [Actinomycetota bacterium]|nr:hypothetical protein [Actinomycetota bacterium]
MVTLYSVDTIRPSSPNGSAPTSSMASMARLKDLDALLEQERHRDSF